MIDISGSMAGESIREAKAGLIYALGTLKPRDSFNIIAFNTGTATLFGEPKLANDGNVSPAPSASSTVSRPMAARKCIRRFSARSSIIAIRRPDGCARSSS